MDCRAIDSTIQMCTESSLRNINIGILMISPTSLKIFVFVKALENLSLDILRSMNYAEGFFKIAVILGNSWIYPLDWSG